MRGDANRPRVRTDMRLRRRRPVARATPVISGNRVLAAATVAGIAVLSLVFQYQFRDLEVLSVVCIA